MSVAVSVFVDWDHDVWSDTPSFTDAIDDITAYVKTWHPHRGLHKEFGNVIAGTLDLVLKNGTMRFSPPNMASPLYGKIKIWRPVLLTASELGADWTVYRGFISKITVYPHENKCEVIIHCTDGIDLLARYLVVLNKENRTALSPGAAMGKLLDAVGWPAAWRNLDTAGGNAMKYPQVL